MSNQSKNDDIEIGNLFTVIGNGITKLFNGILFLLKSLFHFLITILLFFKNHFKEIGIAALIGALIGVIFQFNTKQRYGADMLVHPNFKSARQLYNTIHYYNNLVQQKDSVLLAKTFQLTPKQASTLKRFTIAPIENENDILISYDKLILSVDTLTAKSYSFYQFKKAFTNYDYKIHQINVEATNKNVFSNIDDIIISSVIENEYFNRLKKLTNENLNRTDSLLRKNLAQTDSLHSLYKRVLLEKAKKQNAATSIDLGGKSTSTKELELFRTNRTINENLKEIIENKSDKSEIINVVSNFQRVGYKIKEIQKNYIFQFSILGIFLMISFLLLQQLNKYLGNYKK